jgi:hypothetical protein
LVVVVDAATEDRPAVEYQQPPHYFFLGSKLLKFVTWEMISLFRFSGISSHYNKKMIQ